MKRNHLVLFFSFLFASSSLLAQDYDKMRLGLHFSPNVAWMKHDNDSVSSVNNGIKFSYGLITEFNFNEKYALATGVSILKIGTGLESGGTEVKIDAQYIEIPLALKLKTKQIGHFSYFGKFGLNTNTLISSKGVLSVAGKTESLSVKSDLQPFRLGLVFGFGAEFNLSGSTGLVAGVTFNNGFTQFYRKKGDLGNFKGKSSFMELTIGIIF
jgi:hypothetical protein